MKTSLTKLSSSFFILSFSFAIWAKPVAQVVGVSGSAFTVSADGTINALKLNQHLDDKSEVMVEEGSSVSLNDYYDASYNLTGGSHLKFFNKSVQLKKGKVWIQSLNSRFPLAVTTGNAHINFLKGEFITTFDQGTSRSQVLVVNGEVEVSNVLDQNMKHTVSAGTFTMVDPEVEDGTPRSPTKVGLASLEKALGEFKQLPEKMKTESMPSRQIASVDEGPTVKKGEIIFITSNRGPASVSPRIANKYLKKLLNKKSVAVPVPIKIYGLVRNESRSYEAPRRPASIQAVAPTMPKIVVPTMKMDTEFADSLKDQQIQQPNHPKELENLIHDLKSY